MVRNADASPLHSIGKDSDEIAKALMANADELLAQPPDIQPIDILAEKLPG